MQTKEKKESTCCPSCCSCSCHKGSSKPEQQQAESPLPEVMHQSKRSYRKVSSPAETVEEIRALRRSGMTLKELAKRFEMTQYRVHKYSYDIPSCKVVTPQESERMKQLCAEGHDTKTIAAIMNLSPSTVNKHTYHVRPSKSRRPRRPL